MPASPLQIGLFCGCILLLPTAYAVATAATDGNWVASWACAPMRESSEFRPPSVQPSAQPPLDNREATLRQTVHLSAGGSKVRVVLTNEFGKEALTVGDASAGASATGSGVRAGSMRSLTFSGKTSVIIPEGAVVVSDPVELRVEPLSDLVISLHIPAQKISEVTAHPLANQTNYIVEGSHAKDASFVHSSVSSTWRFLKAVEVESQGGGTIAALGDSITDGTQSTADHNARWTDELARRLQADRTLRKLGVMNLGIRGNRLLTNFSGPNLLARLGSEVLEQPHVQSLIVLEGINDIGITSGKIPPQAGAPAPQLVSADELIRTYEQIIDRAHSRGIKVIGGTLLPYKGARYFSEEGEQVREAVNQWIRMSGRFDGFLDFDRIARDPANPAAMLTAFDSGDHLHPNDAGYKAMGDSVDLHLFQTK